MGYIADIVETSQFAQRIETIQDQQQPFLLQAKDQPHVAPKFVPMFQKLQNIMEADRARAEASHEAGFVNRTQGGHFIWSGPPGIPETRGPRTPEQSGGSLLNWVT